MVSDEKLARAVWIREATLKLLQARLRDSHQSLDAYLVTDLGNMATYIYDKYNLDLAKVEG